MPLLNWKLSLLSNQVWFQNRRAKWRKQARLSLLQDAWRLRCLGLTNSPVVMPNDRQRHSPDIAASPDPHNNPNVSSHAIPLTTTDLKPTEGNIGTHQNDGFTLMHPAFQNVQQKRKYFNSLVHDNDRNGKSENPFFSSMMQNDIGLKKLQPESLSMTNGKFMEYANKLNKSRNIGDAGGDSSDGDSSDSEEIDLTSNGCIDFSNNNNNSEKSENLKKC